MYITPRVLILRKTSVLTGFFFFFACLFYPLLRSAEISTVTVNLSISPRRTYGNLSFGYSEVILWLIHV